MKSNSKVHWRPEKSLLSACNRIIWDHTTKKEYWNSPKVVLVAKEDAAFAHSKNQCAVCLAAFRKAKRESMRERARDRYFRVKALRKAAMEKKNQAKEDARYRIQCARDEARAKVRAKKIGALTRQIKKLQARLARLAS